MNSFFGIFVVWAISWIFNENFFSDDDDDIDSDDDDEGKED